MLQFSLEKRIQDWFLLGEGIVIRVYGFVYQPYILPPFFNSQDIFFRANQHNLIVENEHFINFKKSSKIKFPWVVGLFIIKSKVAFPIVDNFLKEMRFQTITAFNYDPHHIISIRRQVNKNKPFEHQEVAGLVDSANWMDYPQETQNYEDMQYGSTYPMKDAIFTQPYPLNIVPAAERIYPIAIHYERTNKRDFSDAMDTEEEDAIKTPKKQNIEEVGRIVQV